MKIGLISINMYSKKLNFACPLHTYSFQQFLLSKGIESVIIDYKPIYYNDFDLKHPYDYYKRKYDELLQSGKNDESTINKMAEYAKKRDAYKRLYREREIRYEKFQNFIENNYVKTDRCYDSDLLEVCDPGFDCYICVTDVIWKNEPGEGFDRGYFLASKAMENKWKISYAASRGVHFSDSPQKETEFLYYIDDIDYISVRENSLNNYIESNTEKSAVTVLDPVLLNDKSFYAQMIKRPEEDRYILLYYVMERATDTIRIAVEYAKANDIKIVELTDFPYPNRLDNYEGIDKIYRYDLGIEEWLGYIYYAECIFTNSFHGSCFSILFEKNFFVGKRKGDKISNLLNILGLSDRRVSNYAEISAMDTEQIDYEQVNRILAAERERSSRFILDSINSCAVGGVKPPHDYEWWKRAQTFKMIYHSGVKKDSSISAAGYFNEEIEKLPSGNIQYYPSQKNINNGYSRFEKCRFTYKGHRFVGWRIRFRIDKRWFWYLKNEKIVLLDSFSTSDDGELACFEEGKRIPFIPVNHIAVVVAEAVWKEDDTEFIMIYNSGRRIDQSSSNPDLFGGQMTLLPSGSIEYRMERKIKNNGENIFPSNPFVLPEKFSFIGWRLRIKYNSEWYWYLDDETFVPVKEYQRDKYDRIKCFKEASKIPYIGLRDIEIIVAEAVWRKEKYRIIYNSGQKEGSCTEDYNKEEGKLKTLPSGSKEFSPTLLLKNTGHDRMLKNRFSYRGHEFSGWKLRVKEKGVWYWYLEDNSLIRTEDYDDKNEIVKIFSDESEVPYIALNDIDVVVAEAVWKVRFGKAKKRLKKIFDFCTFRKKDLS